ncbi:MAG: hypothetical protein WC496_00020 [Phycisphaerae bacterium]|jgi:hypothetical protein
MKKRLFITILVLCVAPLCKAPIDWSIFYNSNEDLITISVVDPLQEDIYLALAVDDGGILSDFAAGTNAPSESQFYDTLANDGWSVLGQGEIWVMAEAVIPYTYYDGDWLTAAFSFAPGKNFATLSLYRIYSSENPGPVLLDSLAIPEPITVSLLAFGGLFLYRRK